MSDTNNKTGDNSMGNVLLVHIDVGSRMPNLALLKLSRYYKNERYNVYLNEMPLDVSPDIVHVSVMFTKNLSKVEGYRALYGDSVEIFDVGGVAYDMNKDLPECVEHLMPDYSLYDGRCGDGSGQLKFGEILTYPFNHSIGFTSRGCIRECEFCRVPEKEGKLRAVANIYEFYNKQYDKMVLLDNNFFAHSEWVERCLEIIKENIKVSFQSGIDIRILNEDHVRMMKKMKKQIYALNFSDRTITFALDNINMEKLVMKKVAMICSHGWKPRDMIFYVLCDFNTDSIEDLKRVRFLLKMGCFPYVMRFEDRKESRKTNMLYQWANTRQTLKSTKLPTFYAFVDDRRKLGLYNVDEIEIMKDMFMNVKAHQGNTQEIEKMIDRFVNENPDWDK